MNTCRRCGTEWWHQYGTRFSCPDCGLGLEEAVE